MAVCNRFLNLRRAQEASTDEHTSAPALQVLAREAECLAHLPAGASAAAPSKPEWKMKQWPCTAVLDQQFWINNSPPPPGGRFCRPPKFKNGEEMEVWWMEWALGLPNENAGDGPLAWRTRSHYARQEAWVRGGA